VETIGQWFAQLQDFKKKSFWKAGRGRSGEGSPEMGCPKTWEEKKTLGPTGTLTPPDARGVCWPDHMFSQEKREDSGGVSESRGSPPGRQLKVTNGGSSTWRGLYARGSGPGESDQKKKAGLPGTRRGGGRIQTRFRRVGWKETFWPSGWFCSRGPEKSSPCPSPGRAMLHLLLRAKKREIEGELLD